MRLGALLDAIAEQILHVSQTSAQEITDICFDSRMVGPGYLFVALRGEHTDGHHYIIDACSRGAVGIIGEVIPDNVSETVCCVRVTDSKRCFSLLSAKFFDYPSSKIPCIGVTGTNGKSTVIHYIAQILVSHGVRVNYISTVGTFKSGKFLENEHHLTTPDAYTVQSFIADAIGNADIVLVEATSHALSKKTYRLEDVMFFAAVYTNITHEHLDFHGTFSQYVQDKMRLANVLLSSKKSKQPRVTDTEIASTKNDFAISVDPFVVMQWGESFESELNIDPSVEICYVAAAETQKDIKTKKQTMDGLSTDQRFGNSSYVVYSMEEEQLLKCNAIFANSLEEHKVPLMVSGEYNVKNMAMALLVGSKLIQIGLEKLTASCRDIQNPIGRMHSIEYGTCRILIDFAHSPDAFSLFLSHARQHTPESLIVVFGSAGERDYEKRALQGNIAAQYADVIVLCDEDPRQEDPNKVINDILDGIRKHSRWQENAVRCERIADRKQAIEYAVSLLHEYDTLCTLGKGHETSIVYADHEIEWNEIAVVEQAIREKEEVNEGHIGHIRGR